MTDGIEREIGEIKTHIEYIRSGLDEIKGFLKDCPAHRQEFNNHLRNHKKASRRNMAILGSLSSVLGASWREIVTLITGK